ncbi:MAG: thioesterase [Stappia sp.]|uniref:acyl-CoA thioesterase n=1 Tax=Stappia sp. TaxID=1870903 RepID=UPI000C5E0EA2|nr:thioesterase family protein [Stappia sp.]MAB00966.1 thioesterase [Stappia sp.]MBM22456.1 thioesterase [Stappia sp.]|tara:strand:- start:148 stop:585 length:438 start_codon:yes stop_codon:yes gene_type:complete
MSGRPIPFTRDAFPVLRTIPTRWMDVDTYGHVNNVVYLSFFDTAVNAWLIENGAIDPRTSETVFLVVETRCSYFSELVFPDDVTAGIRVARLGGSSVTYEIALFRGEAEEASAQGSFVHVLVDAKTRRSVPIDEARRSLLASITV